MATNDPASSTRTTEMIPIGGARLEGDLVLPAAAAGVVLFAHGSGSSRHSPRNQQVAAVLHQAGLATLLVDLLTTEEERLDARSAQYRFDIGLLAMRLTAIVDWLRTREAVAHLPIGLFGASTGAAAALITAAQRPRDIAAVVSRGGRPDLAGAWLRSIAAPTRLIVGGRDVAVLQMNRDAMALMSGPVDLCVVDGATHLFEEPGALEQVAGLARDWYQQAFHRAAAAAGR
jgi:dienelactone hydrolase